MLKPVFYAAGALVVLAVIVIGAAAFMLSTFDPNDYRDNIRQVVEKATGRTLVIEGPIEMSYYPVLGFSVSQASLGNPAGFGDAPFAQISQLLVGVKLVPLFSGNIEIDTIRIENPEIVAIRKADGRTNLTFDLTSTGGAASVPAPDLPAHDLNVTTGEIAIIDAILTYRDEVSETTQRVEALNVTLSSFAPGAAAPLSVSGRALIAGGVTVSFKGQADMTMAQDLKTVSLAGLDADFDMTRDGASGTFSGAVNGAAVIDLTGGTVALQPGQVTLPGAVLAVEGTYGWAPARLDMTVNADRIDFDTMLAAMPVVEAEDGTAGGADFSALAGLLETMAVNGRVAIDAAHVMGLEATDIQMTAAGQPGTLTLDPVSMTLYEGTYTGRSILAARGGRLSYSEAGQIENVALGPLLTDLTKQQTLTGTAGLTYDVTASGNTLAAMMASLGGTAEMIVTDGTIEYGQISRRINQAVAFFEQARLIDNPDEIVEFTSLKATFTGRDGVLRNNDLLLLAPASHARGAGTVDLGGSTVDYAVRVGLGNTQQAIESAAQLPLRISGPLTAPSYSLDVQALLREQAGAQIEEKKQELLGRALDEIGLGGGDEAASDAAAPADEAAGSDGRAPIDPAQVLDGLFGN